MAAWSCNARATKRSSEPSATSSSSRTVARPSCLSFVLPVRADQHQLAPDGPVGDAQLGGNLLGGVFLQPQPGDLTQLGFRQPRKQRLKLLGDAGGELRRGFVADDL